MLTQLLALRKERLEHMVNQFNGLDPGSSSRVNARGLIGLRSESLTEARGAGNLRSVLENIKYVVRRDQEEPSRPARWSPTATAGPPGSR